MEYKLFERHIIVRLDKGEEILTCLRKVCKDEEVKLGRLSAIGAVSEAGLGIFLTREKRYYSKKLIGDFEIVAFQGNIATKDGNTYIHAHLSVSDTNQNCYGGHCNYAYVSATCELIIDVISGSINRKYSEEVGLNIIEF